MLQSASRPVGISNRDARKLMLGTNRIRSAMTDGHPGKSRVHRERIFRERRYVCAIQHSVLMVLAIAHTANAAPVAPAGAPSEPEPAADAATNSVPAAVSPAMKTTRPVIPRPEGELPAVTPEPPPIALPAKDPAFAEPARTWWKRRSPCPRRSRLAKWKDDISLHGGRVTHGYSCKRGDIYHGPFVSIYSDGTLAETGWRREDKLHGVRREYYPDGKLASEITFVDGREHGPQLFMHSNGKIFRRGVMRDGKRYGRWLEGGDRGFRSERYYGIDGPSVAMGWYPDGRVAFRAELQGEKLDGEQVVWEPNGEVFGLARFRAGSGEWTFWHQSGARWARLSCSDGSVTEASYWDEHGAHVVTYQQPDPNRPRTRSVGPAGEALLAKDERLPAASIGICGDPNFAGWVIVGPTRLRLFSF